MSLLDRLASFVVGRRRSWLVALLFLLVAGAMIGGVKSATRTALATDGYAAGSDSARVVELQDQFPAHDASSALVLYTADTGKLSPEALGALRTQPVLKGGSPLVPSQDGTAAFSVVPITATGNTANAAAVKALRADARAAVPPGVTVQVTGPAAIQADLGAVFEGANTRLLLATAGVVAFLLLVTYRSPFLWLIPLTVVGIADQLAGVLATRVLQATGVAWDESTVGILSVLVFGAGTDYALLLISRYRDELRREEDRYAAMRTALRHTAEAVLLSATTVVLGVLTLLLSMLPGTRGLGLASAVGIVVAAGYALFVLPAVLVLFGRWVFWPVVPKVGQAALVETKSFWRRVGDVVAKRPSAFVAGTLVMLALMAAGLGQIKMGLSATDQFLSKPEALVASERLAKSFPAGSSDPLLVITAGDQNAVVTAVKTLPSVANATVGERAGEYGKVAVILKPTPGSDEAKQAVRDVRAAVSGTSSVAYVGGSEARALDIADASARDRAIIMPLIALLVLAALALLLRSVVAPIILVLTVVATYLAALGASWWIFTKIFGFSGLDTGAPLIGFLFLVALGVDYNIFLVTRAREEAATHGPREGMLRALGATGGVITSAGILLAAVFAVLGVLPLVVLAQIGVIICLGVLLDTLVVRTVLVPAIALILGDRFWWPRKVGPAALEQPAKVA